MNKNRQLWALLKFQAAITPFAFIILMPLVLAMPYYMTFVMRLMGHDYHPGFNQLLSNQNLIFVGLIGVMLLVPEVMRTAATSAQWPTGTEFLLTRAVDRNLVFRARAILFYVIILAIPLCVFPFAVVNPSLQIAEYNKIARRQVLDQMAGSMAAPADKDGLPGNLTIPNGNPLVESWRLWTILCVAIVVQLLIFLICPLKWRRYIFWAVVAGIIFIPMSPAFTNKSDGLSIDEAMFLFFAAHQALIWLVTIVMLFLGQLWCERRFAGLEH